MPKRISRPIALLLSFLLVFTAAFVSTPVNTLASAPISPANISAIPSTDYSGSNVGITWDNVTGAASYNIYRYTTVGESVYTAVYTSSTNSFTDNGVTVGNTYNYSVTAVNADGESSASQIATAYIYPAAYKFDFSIADSYGKPLGPLESGWTEILGQGKGVTAKVTTLYSKEKGYGFTNQVSGRSNGTAYNNVATDYCFAGTFKVDLPNGEYSISMINAQPASSSKTKVTINGEFKKEISKGKADFSSTTFNGITVTDGQLTILMENGSGGYACINGLVITPVKIAPSGLTVTSINVNLPASASIAWNSVPGAQSYNVYRCIQGEANDTFVKSTDSLSYIDTDTKIGRTYIYRVTAVNPNGESIKSIPVTAEVFDSSYGTPTPPAGVTVDRSANQSLIKWSASAGALEYSIYRGSVADVTYSSLIGTATGVNFTDKGLDGSKNYYYFLSVVTKGGESDKTAAILAAAPKPATPTGLYSDLQVSTAIGLSWNKTENAIKYNLYRSESQNGPYTVARSVYTLTVTDTGLTPSKDYYYKIASVNEGGESNLSEAIKVATTAPTQLPTDATAYKFDFGSDSVQAGYTKVLQTTAYIPDIGYGFADTSLVDSKDRGTQDALRSDFCIPGATTFNVDLANGDYNVTVISGDELEATSMDITAEGLSKLTGVTANPGEYKTVSFTISLIDGQLNLAFPGTAPRVNAVEITKLPAREAGSKSTVYIVGDSTVQTYDPYWRPQAGWGQMISQYFTSDVLFDNRAIGGRSSKSFINEGRLDAILNQIKPNDYLFIQFGHNDATIDRPERYCTPEDYKNYLKQYVDGARQRGAIPVLVTPVARRSYNADGTFNISFPDYRAKMMELAAEENVCLVDLGKKSVDYLTSKGIEMSTSIFLYVDAGIYEGGYASGKKDDTHFQEFGAIQMARLVSEGVKELGIGVSDYVTQTEVTELPAVPANLQTGTVTGSSVSMKWDAAKGADLYKIYRSTVTNGVYSDYSLAGTTTVTSFIDSNAQEATEYCYKVSAVNGLGESAMSEPASAVTKKALYKFDFGTETSPVAAGYTQVANSLVYTPERGYGLSAKADCRDRGIVNNVSGDVERDFILSQNITFMVDLPNGDYSVKIISGDSIGTAVSTFNIEGNVAGTIKASKNVSSQTFNARVTDGQLDILNTDQGRLNGVEITPVFMAPTGLKVSDFTVMPTQSVTLTWNSTDGARSYNVYRMADGESQFVKISNVKDLTYTDTSVDMGMSYKYRVTGVNPEDKESIPTNEASVSLADTKVVKPAAPTGLSLVDAASGSVSFKWDPVSTALKYYVYRATTENGAYSRIASVDSSEYTDTSITTHIPYYYKLAAVNAGGLSDKSDVFVSPVKVVLARQMEKLDRGLIAMKADNGVFVSWRMFGTDRSDISFCLYRDGVKINTEPITNSTNYLDKDGTDSSTYFIRAVINGEEQENSETVKVWSSNYLSIPITKPASGVTPAGELYTYSANDATVADLDGDGEYEIILNWQPSNSKDNGYNGYTGNVYVDAYKLDGRRLWRIDLGKNIRAGAHYLDILAYDFDGDGKAEVTFRTADGTIDGQGNVIGNGSADYRNSSGRIILGPEYHTVFEGTTGKALVTENYEPERGTVQAWGDDSGNRSDRFLAAVAYLDGKTPSIIMQRGYYTRLTVAAYNFRDGKLTKLWMFDSNDAGNEAYFGQGNHQLSVADVDGDGYDEIITGPAAIDHDGKPLWNSHIGHGDALHVGDLDPTTPGYEIWKANEGDQSAAFMNATTGEIRFKIKGNDDVGRALSADIDPNYPGEEVWAAIPESKAVVDGLYNNKGEKISSIVPKSTNFAIWWDGDLQRELFDHDWDGNGTGIPVIQKWDYKNNTTGEIARFNEMRTNNWTKGTPCLQADILGDWREELVLKNADSTELRIYSTTDLTDKRIYTLMHDPLYRLDIAWQNTGYNQPPHTSFFFGYGMAEPPKPMIELNSSGVVPIMSEAPTGLACANVDNSSASLVWNPVEGAVGYKIYRTYEGVTKELNEVSKNSYIDSGLTPGKLYYYQVTAVNVTGESSKTETLRVKTVLSPGSVVVPTCPAANNADGSKTTVDKTTGIALTEVNESVVLKDLDGNVAEFTLPAAEVSTQKLSLTKEAVQLLSQKKADVKLNVNGVTLIIPNQVISDAGDKSLTVTVKETDTSVDSQIGKSYELAIEAVSGTDTKDISLNNKVRLSMSLPEGVQSKGDTRKMGIYLLNSETGKPEYVGGKYNPETNAIEAKTASLGTFAVIEYTRTFDDVPAGSWAKEYVDILSAKHITEGVSEKLFNPEGKVSRAEFATFLVRALEIDKAAYSGTFKDVEKDSWYAPYIEAAKKAGIINGVEADRFDPDGTITREEMAVMIIRAYSILSKTSISDIAKDSASSFADIGSASDWAKDSILAARNAGIINGVTDSTFAPKDTVQRDQAAKMLVKLMELLKLI